MKLVCLKNERYRRKRGRFRVTCTKACEFGDIGTMTPINKDEALEIYKMAW